MYWHFQTGWYLLNTFGMTGQWSPTVGKHPCLTFHFTDGSQITFNDPRHFGTIKFAYRVDLCRKLNELGWDPLQDDWAKWRPFVVGQLKTSGKCIGELLMDQQLFAGVGNYIRAEALYRAQISPWRTGSSLSEADIDTLAKAIVSVMQDSYAHQGATILTYQNAYGAEGKYQSQFQIYGKKHDPLGHPITKENTPDKRAIHWCPAIQK
jgi:formamidopyrimidine-DNA glycosylase